MPIFEGEDIDKMRELMDNKAKAEFLAKRKRIEDKRQEEIDALNEVFAIDSEEDDNGIFRKVDGS